MKKILSILLCFFLMETTEACTTFCINRNGQIVFGRNYDWISGQGIVNTNQRGLFKTSMRTGDGGASISWISRYGSVTFNQYGKEFPTGGMNEKGLVVELMWLDGTVYPSADERPAIGVLQWIQYQLDNASTTAEVISSDSQLRISDKGTPLHYLIADASGNAATIEFLAGKMVVHKDEALPYQVLTNSTYTTSIATAQPLLDKNVPAPLQDNSLDRFVKACSMLKQFKETSNGIPATDFAFSILDKVSQGDHTKWSIVYDITNKKVYFKTAANKDIKNFSFSAFDFACALPAKMFNMNHDMKGEISHQFTLPDRKVKQQVMDRVVEESSRFISISKKEEDELLNYEEGTTCRL